MSVPADPHARCPLNTCGHRAPRVTLPARCSRCGAYAERASEPAVPDLVEQCADPALADYRPAPRLWWLLEWLTRRYVRSLEPPRLEGRITRS